ncbi:MAG: creatininase family protein [Anaerolinea sp.]|nr:creatininase family protein [Anaerolinea sp.]
MRLQDMNWMDVERYLQTDNRIILITGATEQHGYLSLFTDILIPSRLALAVSERTGVVVAPPLNFGVSEYFNEFPGTISISQSTFDLVLTDLVEGLYHQGFAHFFILNGHGGNRLPQRLHDMAIEGLVRLDWYSWWEENAAQTFAREHGLHIDHANWGENFPFCRVADVPLGEKPPVNLELQAEGKTMREILGDGSFGGPYQIDDERMMQLFERVVDEICARLA